MLPRDWATDTLLTATGVVRVECVVLPQGRRQMAVSTLGVSDRIAIVEVKNHHSEEPLCRWRGRHQCEDLPESGRLPVATSTKVADYRSPPRPPPTLES